MPDDISFLSIPANLRDPGTYVEFDNSQAQGPLPVLPRRRLIFAIHLASSLVAASQLTRMLGRDDGKKNFGRGSMAAAMVEAAFAADDTNSTELYVIGVDEPSGGTAAIWHVTYTAASVLAGTDSLYIGGPSKNGLSSAAQVQTAITAGMSAAAVATAVTAAINALPDLPVTAAVDGTIPAQVNITARHKGAWANDLDIRGHYYRGDQPPTGLSKVIAVGTAGSGTPVLTAAITAMGTKWFTDIINPFADSSSLSAIGTEMERRWGPTVQQDGMIYSFSPLSIGSVESLGATLNEKLLSVVGLPVCPTSSWVCASIIGTLAAYYLQIDPGAPLDSSIVLPGIAAPASADQLQHPDREALMHDGIATLGINANGDVVFNRMITTYQVNAANLPDASYLDVETMATLAYLRFWVRARIANRWPRYKLEDDPPKGQSLPRGQRVTCPKLIGADLVAGSGDLAEAGIITSVGDFAAKLQVVLNTTNAGEVDAKLPWSLIRRFRVFAAQINFRL